MISNKILPAHVLRLYTWELLKANLNMQLVDGKVPFVPLNEEPDMANSGKTYIVYGYSEQAQGGVKQVKHGSFSMRVIAQSFSELGSILTVIEKAFENQDASAANVNMWSSKQINTLDLIGLKFTSLETTYVEGGSAPDTMDGPVEGLINISYDYISHQKIKTFTSTGAWV